jgi:tryptophan-rich sensory protein
MMHIEGHPSRIREIQIIRRKRQGIVLAGFVLLCLAIGGVGGWLTVDGVATWYQMIAKPSWRPPDWVFGPVWTALYIMMGCAGWLIWRGDNSPGRRPALVAWFAQLALNFFWSPLFFGFHTVGLALIDIYLLWLLIGRFFFTAWSLSRPAAFLFSVYWVWVTYATALNLAIWLMNRS